MAFVKVLKNKAYSKRYQTKNRRRRQGKTDYYARKRLVVNDKDKYDSKKYRFVVRRTNKRIICSIVYATIEGDKTMCTADSAELAKHGVKNGLTNYASAYCVGLLLARRLLQQKEMAEMYKGNDKVDGTYYSVGDPDKMGDRRPFKAYLDVGLVRTTTGNRVFGAMKGACDGGLYIPHNEKRFPGHRWQKAEEEGGKKKKAGNEKTKPVAVFTAEEHLEHIQGVHVQEYYDLLKKEDPMAFKKQFSRWEKELKGKSFEDYYTAAHKSIRKDPKRAAKDAKKKAPVRKVIQKAPVLIQQNSKGKKWLRLKKIDLKMRQERVQKKLVTLMS